MSTARNNMAPESQRYVNELRRDVDTLKAQMSLLQSQGINSQLNRLATGVGNSMTKVVPYKAEGSTPGARYPIPVDFRYDWVVFNLDGNAQSIFTGVIPPTYGDNCNMGLVDSGTDMPLARSISNFAAYPSNLSLAHVSLNAAVRISDITPGTVPYLDLSTLSEGFTETTNTFYVIRGSYTHFKENS